MKKLVYSLLALSLAACGGKNKAVPANQLATNDFESIDGWVGETPSSLTKEKAHSGRYAVKVDPAIEYGMGYSNLLGKMSPSKIKKVKIHAWVNIPDSKSETVLVTQVMDPANPAAPALLWEGLKLTDKVKSYNKWVEIEKEVTLPDNVTYANKFSTYLWRTSVPSTVYLDDMTIEKVE